VRCSRVWGRASGSRDMAAGLWCLLPYGKLNAALDRGDPTWPTLAAPHQSHLPANALSQLNLALLSRPVRDALAEGEKLGRYPIVLADHADNTGGGAPGDSTEVLRTFLDMGLQGALVLYLVDPEVVAQAHAAGVGSRIQVN